MPPSNPPFLDRVLTKLQQQIRPEQFETWFRGFSLSQHTDDEVEFCVPSGFMRDWLNRNYYQKIQDAVDTVAREGGVTAGARVRISLDTSLLLGEGPRGDAEELRVGDTVVRDALAKVMHQVEAPLGADTRRATTGSPAGSPADGGPPLGPERSQTERLMSSLRLNEQYTFDHFVVGPSNQLPHAASLAVGQNPGRAYNPLFIHGNVGLGKTHLLQSICHSIRRRMQSARVVYLSCEEFTNRYILAAQTGKLDVFRDFYRSADVLVIDDVQFLAGKDKTQEEFFHTFNSLYNAQKQIVISSDRTPAEIPTVEERLVSRFKWGLVTDIQQPCFETRLAIVKRKALQRCGGFPDEVAQFVAERITHNVREVEGAVIKIVGVAAVTGRSIDLALAEEALQGMGHVRPTKIGIPDVINLITTEFSVSTRDLTGKSRTQKISLPRQIGMYFSREYTDHSLEEVGRYFGNRDHTTVLYAVTKIKRRQKADRMFRELLMKLSSRLESGDFGRAAEA